MSTASQHRNPQGRAPFSSFMEGMLGNLWKRLSTVLPLKYQVGDRVMVHEASEKTAKLARPYFGPYCVLNVTTTNAEVRLIDKPDDPSIFVSFDRVCPCFGIIAYPNSNTFSFIL